MMEHSPTSSSAMQAESADSIAIDLIDLRMVRRSIRMNDVCPAPRNLLAQISMLDRSEYLAKCGAEPTPPKAGIRVVKSMDVQSTYLSRPVLTRPSPPIFTSGGEPAAAAAGCAAGAALSRPSLRHHRDPLLSTGNTQVITPVRSMTSQGNSHVHGSAAGAAASWPDLCLPPCGAAAAAEAAARCALARSLPGQASRPTSEFNNGNNVDASADSVPHLPHIASRPLTTGGGYPAGLRAVLNQGRAGAGGQEEGRMEKQSSRA